MILIHLIHANAMSESAYVVINNVFSLAMYIDIVEGGTTTGTTALVYSVIHSSLYTGTVQG
jgi:Flp pilus assembly CpaF family ATPase